MVLWSRRELDRQELVRVTVSWRVCPFAFAGHLENHYSAVDLSSQSYGQLGTTDTSCSAVAEAGEAIGMGTGTPPQEVKAEVVAAAAAAGGAKSVDGRGERAIERCLSGSSAMLVRGAHHIGSVVPLGKLAFRPVRAQCGCVSTNPVWGGQRKQPSDRWARGCAEIQTGIGIGTGGAGGAEGPGDALSKMMIA